MRLSHTLGAAGVLAAFACGPQRPADSAESRPSSGTVIVDGAELRWVREGEGPVVFALGSAVYYPKAYSPELRDHFEFVFVDGRHFVPGYDPGADALSEVSLATFADDVEAVRTELGYDQIAVIGHSVHGQIALEYADRYPASTSAVILIGAVPYRFAQFADATDRVWEQYATPERRQLMEARLKTLDAVVGAAPEVRRFATSYIHRSPLYWADPAFDATDVLEGLENGPAFNRLFSSLPDREEARARLLRIDAPILLVLGKLDFAVPFTTWEDLLGEQNSIDYVLLEEDSHNPMTEFPERFDPILIDWFEQHGR